jgi:hypothetical protein
MCRVDFRTYEQQKNKNGNISHASADIFGVKIGSINETFLQSNKSSKVMNFDFLNVASHRIRLEERYPSAFNPQSRERWNSHSQ